MNRVGFSHTAIVAAAVVAVVLAPQAKGDTASATFYTGNQLLAMCQAKDAAKVLVCTGYINGISDVLSLERAIGRSVFKLACIPPDVTSRQTVNLVVRSLVAHPEERSSPASAMVINALLQAFPCG